MRHYVEIIGEPPCASDLLASVTGVDRATAWKGIQALIKAGYTIAPREPVNLMFDAYMHALNMPAVTPLTIINNVGKARKRWKAMADVGQRVALSVETAGPQVNEEKQP